MADTHKRLAAPDPHLIAPVNEALIDGHSVTFEWEPVEDALEYTLQVAPDSSFEHLLHEESTSGASLTVAGRFAIDGDTLFWRVLAHTAEGWSSGETVESFISGTAAEAALHLDRPDDDEHYGPYPELLRSAGVEVAAEVSGKEKFYAQEEAMGVEHEGVETGQILGIFAVTLLAIILLIITVFMLVNNLERTVREQVTGISGYPELQQVNEQAQDKLQNYGIIDEAAGVYQVPIGRAMELMVQEAGGQADSVAQVEGPANAPAVPGE